MQLGTIQMCEEMAEMLKTDPTWAEKGKDLSCTMTFVFQAPIDSAFFVRFDMGQIADIGELSPGVSEPSDYIISGAPEVWRAVLGGKMSPIFALTRGQLRVKGKKSSLLKRMPAFRHILDSMASMDLS
jgi:putative sterol carrier protein